MTIAELEQIVLEETQRGGHDDDDDLAHLYCECNPDIGLCGADLTDYDFLMIGGVDPEDCVVCFDLYSLPCARCGK